MIMIDVPSLSLILKRAVTMVFLFIRATMAHGTHLDEAFEITWFSFAQSMTGNQCFGAFITIPRALLDIFCEVFHHVVKGCVKCDGHPLVLVGKILIKNQDQPYLALIIPTIFLE